MRDGRGFLKRKRVIAFWVRGYIAMQMKKISTKFS
jgi:hypothetical protein